MSRGIVLTSRLFLYRSRPVLTTPTHSRSSTSQGLDTDPELLGSLTDETDILPSRPILTIARKTVRGPESPGPGHLLSDLWGPTNT